jgi:membrane-associated phospholipid phosphatase
VVYKIQNIMHLKKIAKIISYLFVPPVTNFLIFIFYSFYFEKNIQVWYSIFISFLLGLTIPIYTFLQFRKKGKILNDDATIKEERTIPYIYSIFFTLSGVIMSGFLHLDVKIIMLWMIYVITSIVIINVNRFWKISAHAMGAAIPLGASVIINEVHLFLIILLLVSWSRFYLKVHTITQILAGGVLGFLTSYLLLRYCV